MPPESSQPPDHTRWIVGALTIIALVCIGCTTFLLSHGYQQGELMVGIASGAAGSLGTMLAMRRPNQTTPSGAIATEVTNQSANPLPVTEVPKNETYPSTLPPV